MSLKRRPLHTLLLRDFLVAFVSLPVAAWINLLVSEVFGWSVFGRTTTPLPTSEAFILAISMTVLGGGIAGLRAWYLTKLWRRGVPVRARVDRIHYPPIGASLGVVRADVQYMWHDQTFRKAVPVEMSFARQLRQAHNEITLLVDPDKPERCIPA